MKVTIKMRKRPSKGKHFFENSNCNFFSKDHPRAFIFGIGTPCLWNEGFWKGAKVFFSFHFIFWSLTIIVVRRKGWKPGKTTAISFQHLLPAWTKFRVSYHYHNCFVWLWVGIFKSTSSSSSPSSIDLNWTFKHKKNWFLIVYFQCIRKYKDYTFDYDDMAV